MSWWRGAATSCTSQAAVAHVVMNASDSEPAVAVLARTDADEQEDVTQLPHLERLVHQSVGTPR